MVGIDARGFDVDVVDLVWPERVHRGHVRKEGGIGTICAIVEQHPSPPSGQSPVVLEPGGDLDDHAFPTSIRSKEFLFPREHQSDGSAGCPCEGGDVCFVVETALASETATHVWNDDSHTIGGEIEGLADSIPGLERDLSGAPNRHPIAPVYFVVIHAK